MKVITLTTDFGSTDHYVAALKGALLSKNSELQIIDVTHAIDSHDIVQGAYHLKHAYNTFPKGSVHVVAVYNFYSADFEFVVFEKEGQYFIGPNNGMFSLVFGDLNEEEIYKIKLDGGKQAHLVEIISHGVGCLVHGLSPSDIGPVVEHFNAKIGIQPVLLKDQIRATIVHVDHFENVIVNVTKDVFEKVKAGREFSIFYKQNDPITKIHNKYGDVHVGDVLCLFNSAGLLEISINMGKASSLLGLFKNETIQINFH